MPKKIEDVFDTERTPFWHGLYDRRDVKGSTGSSGAMLDMRIRLTPRSRVTVRSLVSGGEREPGGQHPNGIILQSLRILVLLSERERTKRRGSQ